MSDTSTTRTHAHRIAEFAVSARANDVPREVVDSARQRLVDTVGICLAAGDLETSRAVIAYVRALGGAEQATVIGTAVRVPSPMAAFANGVLAHSLDYDDTHLPSVLHPSASVVPAVLATAEECGSDGRAVLAATAVGIEVVVRLGMAGYDSELGNSVFFENGQHATSICGTLGAAVAAAMLLGLDEDQVAHALGLAASFSGGILEGNRNGGTVKRAHCGWAAHGGVVAAHLARSGFTGPATVLEGRFGFFRAYLGEFLDSSALIDGLGEDWSVPGIFFKPYPANHFTHAVIDAALALGQRGLRPDEIDQVELRVPTAAARTIGEPIEVKRKPQTGYQGQFSAPYAFTAALFGGGGLGVALEDFSDDLVHDPARRELMARVSVVGDAECDRIFPHQFPAIAHVTTRDGRRLVERVLTNRGGPDRPLSDEEIARKFRDNAEPRLGHHAAQEFLTMASAMAEADTIDWLLALTTVDDPSAREIVR